MFAMSRRDIKDAYRCGEYHRRGRSGCTSHHIRVDKLDELLKIYVRRVLDSSAAMIEHLNADLAKENDDVAEAEQSADNLAAVLEDLQEELKVTKRQRIRDVLKHPDQEALLEQTYDELESDLQKKIEGLNHQIDLISDKRNTILQVNRVAKTALDVFQDILNKPTLERNDLELIIRQVKVYEDHLEIQLQADIDALLHAGVMEIAANFEKGTENIEPVTVIQSSANNRPDKVFCANVIGDGDPLEIYTDKEGGVIFKKYSLMGGLADFSGQMCETLNKTTGHLTVITDRDSCLSVAGCAKRELVDKRLSPELEAIMEGRQIYQYTGEGKPLPVCEDSDKYFVCAAAPILSEGDVLGSVLFVSTDGEKRTGEIEYKLLQTIAGFLGRHMET
jgi:stage V sporulation protein T